MTRHEPQIHTAAQRPFEGYQDQPDTTERVRREVQSLPFGFPEKMLRTGLDSGSPWSEAATTAAEDVGLEGQVEVMIGGNAAPSHPSHASTVRYAIAQ